MVAYKWKRWEKEKYRNGQALTLDQFYFTKGEKNQYLVKKAKDNGSSDNITAIFVLLKEDLNQISSPEVL